MSSKEIIQFYAQFAPHYDQTVEKDKDYIAFTKIPRWMTALLKNKANILDLGCGTGLSSLEFFDRGDLVTGIDITPEMLEKAQKRPYQALLCQSLENPLPFEKNSFDGAVMLGVMEFIQNPQALFHQISLVLKQRGLLGITIPKKLSQEKTQKLGILTYLPEEIELLFKQARFRILHRETFQGFISESIVVDYEGYLLRKEICTGTSSHSEGF